MFLYCLSSKVQINWHKNIASSFAIQHFCKIVLPWSQGRPQGLSKQCGRRLTGGYNEPLACDSCTFLFSTIITKTLSSSTSSLWPSRSWSLSPAATLEVPPTPQTALTGSPNGPGQMPPPNKNLKKTKNKGNISQTICSSEHWVQQPTIDDKSAQKYVLLQDFKTVDLPRKVTKDTWTHLSVTRVWSLAAKVKVKNC